VREMKRRSVNRCVLREAGLGDSRDVMRKCFDPPSRLCASLAVPCLLGSGAGGGSLLLGGLGWGVLTIVCGVFSSHLRPEVATAIA
jgi:hypothetical protein